ncbi:MAG: hypothetical protein IT215_02020 [Chitinophagaceae bacterium]|nr:hypothetical protein [Chitinophagaceae bacterium]
MNLLNKIIEDSKLNFLNNIEFIEKTPGRYFQKNKTLISDNEYQFYVVLGPNVESPIHNHVGQNMEETHKLLYGSGKFIIYRDNGKTEQLELKLNEFHPIFSDMQNTPDHKYIAGPKGSVTLALEKYLK